MKIRFITFDLIKRANDWIRQTRKEQEKAEKLFWRTAEKYKKSLEELKPRLGRKAWEFFYYGYGPTGLYDASLLKFSAGDALSYNVDGKEPFKRNNRKAAAKIEILNYEQDLYYIFDLRGVQKINCELLVDSLSDIGDLFTYEIFSVNEKLLQIGFVFVSGSTIIAQFHKLVFTKQKIHRDHSPGNTYK